MGKEEIRSVLDYLLTKLEIEYGLSGDVLFQFIVLTKEMA